MNKKHVKECCKTDQHAKMKAINITNAMPNSPAPVEGRIWFPGNPWPGGHRVVSCKFSAAIEPAIGAYAENYANPGPGLLLQFELITANYDEEDAADRDGAGDTDWASKIVWNNYGSCRITASESSQVSGVRVSDGSTPFAFDLDEYRFSVDPLPIEWDRFQETAAFGIYLLGHDSVADHDIHLHSHQPDDSYTLDWRGRIALSYSGHTDFEHSFHAHVKGVKFESIMLFYFNAKRAKEYHGIDLDPALSARDYIAPFVADPDNFVFETHIDGLQRPVVYAIRKADR
jgi:hypothetical protein